MKRLLMIAVLSLAMWCTGLATSGVSAATLTYSLNMTWTNPSPACVDPVVCSGVGTPAFAYGVPTATSTQVTLTLAALAKITQTNSAFAKAGTLTYCNGSIDSTSNVNSVDLNAAFTIDGGASGSVAPTTLLVNTPNVDGDPVGSADVLSLSSAPGIALHVLEDHCATIGLIAQLTTGATPVLTVGLGEVTTPDSGYVTVDGRRQVDIDIRPHERPRPINLSSKEVIPVAIYGSTLNDVTKIDQPTVEFEGATPTRQKILDVNHDGVNDLLIFVPTQAITTLQPGDTSACATFADLDGSLLGGCQSIQVIRTGRGSGCHGAHDRDDRAFHDRWSYWER